MYGDRPEPVEAARTFVAARFPEASVAFVGGSVLTEHRTPTSDLDVVVVVGEDVTVADSGMRAPYRETFEHDGWVVEAFVHTRSSLDRFWASDAERGCARCCGCAWRVRCSSTGTARPTRSGRSRPG